MLWNIVKIISGGKNHCNFARLLENHPRANKKGLVPVARVIMENHLNRLLTEDEVVYHINCNNKDDNIENLMVRTRRRSIEFKNCPVCQKQTKNPKFCSTSCSATYTNAHRSLDTYRQLEGLCKTCGKPISSSRTYCKKCYIPIPLEEKWNEYSLAYMQDMYDNYQKSSRLREIARKVYKLSDKPKYCVVCGYDKHYEVCHIKPIKSFHPDTLVKEVNDINNLMSLCPNCHWEYDHEKLTLDEIKERMIK